jgi:hypothetical protein
MRSTRRLKSCRSILELMEYALAGVDWMVLVLQLGLEQQQLVVVVVALLLLGVLLAFVPLEEACVGLCLGLDLG